LNFFPKIVTTVSDAETWSVLSRWQLSCTCMVYGVCRVWILFSVIGFPMFYYY